MPTAVSTSAPRIGGLAGRVGRDPNHPAPGGKPLLFADGAAFGQCPVCLEKTNKVVAVYPCGHSFCGECDARMDGGAPAFRRCAVCRAETPRELGPVAYPLAPALRSGHANFVDTMAKLGDLKPRRIAAPRHVTAGPAPVQIGAAASDACGFATLFAIPSAPAAGGTCATLYILDKSGSMHNDFPEVLETMQGVLEASTGSYVAVIVFSDTADVAVPPHCVTAESIPATMATLRGVAVRGQTQIHLALEKAEPVAQEMRARLAADGSRAEVLALIVTDGAASSPGLAAAALGRSSMGVFVAGYGTNFSYQECHELFAVSGKSAANYAEAATTAALAGLLGERRTLCSTRIACAPGSEVYCNGRVVQVGAAGEFETTFDPSQGLRFAVDSPTPLDFSTLSVGRNAAPTAHSAALGLEVANFMRTQFTLQYVMDLGSKLPDHDTQTLRTLLSHVSRVVRELPGMAEVAGVIAEQIAQADDSDGNPNATARVASNAIRALSCA